MSSTTTEKPATVTEETKPLDRVRPFKRIHNAEFVPKKAPDGLGKACGCQTPEDFGEFEKEYEEYLKEKNPTAKVLLDALETVRTIAEDAASIPILGDAVGIPAAVAEILTAVKKFFYKIARRILPRAVRATPQYVPVKKGASSSLATADQIVEVEGIVSRSYGNPVETPFWQWHRWFNWSIHVKPEPGYENVRSAGVPNPPNTTGLEAGESAIAEPDSFEIQWDVGALYDNEEAYERGFKKSGKSLEEWFAENDGLMAGGLGWLWPMKGMYAWAAGRWVYDCSRVTTGKTPKMGAMLNPCKALATARWAAAKFAENPHLAPAIQFMFVASKRGGYIDHETIKDHDYEFILDLPPAPAARTAPFPIGHTGKSIPHNTIFVRPRLLQQVSPLEVTGSRTAKIVPRVEIIPPEPGKPPAQVKVTVPLSAQAGNATPCGFVLSLGWHDPDLREASKVRKCMVTVADFTARLQKTRDSGIERFRELYKEELTQLTADIAEAVADNVRVLGVPILQIPGLRQLVGLIAEQVVNGLLDAVGLAGPLEKEEWLMRVGVNGHWESRYFDSVGSAKTMFNPPLDFSVWLTQEDSLTMSVHGMEFDSVGDMMLLAHRERIIRTDYTGEVAWPGIVSPHPDPTMAKKLRREMVMDYVFKTMLDLSAGRFAFGFDNSPIGMLDPGGPGHTPGSNPLEMNGEQNFSSAVTAGFGRATREQCILVQNQNVADYSIRYSVQVTPQKVK